MSNSSPPFPVFTTYTYRTQRFTIIFLAQKETSKQTNLALLLRCTQTQKKSWVKKLSRLEKLLSSSWHLFFKVNIRVHGQSVSIRYLKSPNNSFQFLVLIRMSFYFLWFIPTQYRGLQRPCDGEVKEEPQWQRAKRLQRCLQSLRGWQYQKTRRQKARALGSWFVGMNPVEPNLPWRLTKFGLWNYRDVCKENKVNR